MTSSFAIKWPLAFLSLLPLLVTSVFGAAPSSYIVYVGTYTNATSKGIYAWRMDAASGALSPLGLVAETPNPTFIQIAPNHRFLYAANEVGNFQGKPAGGISAFSIDASTGQLALLNSETSGGPGPCHLIVDHANANVLAANYDGGSIECLPVQPDGRLGAPTEFIKFTGKGFNPARQQAPHAHCMTLDPAGQFVFVCDLGLDRVDSYHFNSAKGTLSPGQPPFTSTKPGAGPRHMTFHPDGRQAYVLNEIDSTIVRYSYDPAQGTLTELQTVRMLPPEFTGVSTGAEIVVSSSGKFLYGSNRGDDSIVVYSIDPATGNLTQIQRVSTGGKTPRNFAIDPTGKFLFAANQNSANIVIFNIDPASGQLTPSGKVLSVSAPVCIQFLPAPAPAAAP